MTKGKSTLNQTELKKRKKPDNVSSYDVENIGSTETRKKSITRRNASESFRKSKKGYY